MSVDGASPAGWLGFANLFRSSNKWLQLVCTIPPREEKKDAKAVFRAGLALLFVCLIFCHRQVVDPRTGRVYWTNASGDVLEYDDDDADADANDAAASTENAHGQSAATRGRKGLLRVIAAGDSGGLQRHYFGSYAPEDPGHMAYHWRQVQWVEGFGIVGVHGNSGMLFRLALPCRGSQKSAPNRCATAQPTPPTRRPWSVQVEVLGRIASKPSQRLGLHDQFSYGYEVTSSP